MVEANAIQTVVMQATIQKAMVAVMVMKEADVGPHQVLMQSVQEICADIGMTDQL